MKPGDHPEFFRFPAPAGTSRESSIRIDKYGNVFHNGELVDKPRLAKALLSWVRRHPDDHRFVLSNGYDWTYVDVEATPFFVVDVCTQGEPMLVLSNGTEQPLRGSRLSMDADGVCYAKVQGSEDEARFVRHAQHALAAFVAEDEPIRLIVSDWVELVATRT